MGRGVLPVRAYVLTVQDEGDGLCMGVPCVLTTQGLLECLGEHKGTSYYPAAEWSRQHHLVKGQRARQHHS